MYKKGNYGYKDDVYKKEVSVSLKNFLEVDRENYASRRNIFKDLKNDPENGWIKNDCEKGAEDPKSDVKKERENVMSDEIGKVQEKEKNHKNYQKNLKSIKNLKKNLKSLYLYLGNK